MESELVSQFMEITACTSQAHAVRHLSSCQRDLEEAIDQFFAAGGYVAGPSDAAAPPSPHVEEPAQEEDYGTSSDDEQDVDDEEEDEEQSDDDSDSDYYGVETEEDDDYYDAAEEVEEAERDQAEQSPPPRPRAVSLDQMFQPPFELMFRGSFHYANVHAATQDRFLLVNLQAGGHAEFASLLHNRDLWADSAVKQMIKDNLVFLLLKKSDGDYGDEGTKVCTFYKIQDDQLPAVLVLDPVTGQLLAKKFGAIQSDEFAQFINKYTKSKPSEQFKSKIVPKTAAVAGGTEAAGAGDQEPAKPSTAGAGVEQQRAAPESSAPPGDAGGEQKREPEPRAEEAAATEDVDSDDDEPMEGEKIYKMRVRFPDGKVVLKEFGCQRRVSKLFAFCKSAVRDAGKTELAAFRIMKLNGRAFEELKNDGATFEESGLNCATVSVVFAA